MSALAPSSSPGTPSAASSGAVEGRLVPYGIWTEIDSPREGHFLERFAPGALRRSITSLARMRGYFEHGKSQLFDRMPIMALQRVWEQNDGAWFTAELLRGLPEWMVDGLRRGLYGTSIGARVVAMDRVRHSKRSAHNPKGLEERTYIEVDAFDISLTSRPQYAGTEVALRSATVGDGAIWRVSASPVLLGRRTRRDFLAEEPARIVPDYLHLKEPTMLGTRAKTYARCTRTIQSSSGMRALVYRGEVLPSDDWRVERHGDAFEPVEPVLRGPFPGPNEPAATAVTWFVSSVDGKPVMPGRRVGLNDRLVLDDPRASLWSRVIPSE